MTGAAGTTLPTAQRDVGGAARPLAGSLATGVAGNFILIVSGILAARLLSVEDRGIVALLATVPVVAVRLGALGLPSAVTYEVARSADRTWGVLGRIGPIVLVMVLVMSAGAGLAVVWVGPRIAGTATWLPVLLATVPVGVIFVHQLGLGVLQGLHKYLSFNVLRLSPAALYAIFLLGLSVITRLSASMALIAWIAAQSVAAAATVAVVRGHVWRTPEPAESSAGGMLAFGLSGFLGGLALFEGIGADQLLVGFLFDPTQLGLFVVASAFCNLNRFIAQSYGFVLYPHVIRSGRVDVGRLIGGHCLRAFALLLLVTSVLILTVDRLVAFLFTERYAAAVPIAVPLLVASLVMGVRRVLIDGVRGTGHAWLGTAGEVAILASLAVLVAWTRPVGAVEFAWCLAGAALTSICLVGTLAVVLVRRFAS